MTQEVQAPAPLNDEDFATEPEAFAWLKGVAHARVSSGRITYFSDVKSEVEGVLCATRGRYAVIRTKQQGGGFALAAIAPGACLPPVGASVVVSGGIVVKVARGRAAPLPGKDTNVLPLSSNKALIAKAIEMARAPADQDTPAPAAEFERLMKARERRDFWNGRKGSPVQARHRDGLWEISCVAGTVRFLGPSPEEAAAAVNAEKERATLSRMAGKAPIPAPEPVRRSRSL